MAYGLWLYKEIVNDTGKKTRLEIEKRDYTGQSYEITALSGDIVLSIDAGSATDPIVKSNLSFSIIDTAQVTYSDFFTPDATLYKVKMYDVSGQTQTIRWTGYITPDSFGEPLTYRGQINLTARDNLGYLNDLEFDYNNATSESYASIKNIVNAAIAKIGGMSVVCNVAKKATTQAGGTYDNIEDAIVSTYNMLGDTWGNVVSELLRGIGCQLRYIDGNTFAVYDIEVLSNSATFTAQQVRFLEQSGYREIQPAWKNAVFNQDYGLLTKFNFKYPSSFSGDIQRVYGSGVSAQTFLMHGVTDEWTVHNNNVQWGLYSPADGITNGDTNALYVPFLDMDDEDRPDIYVEKGIELNKTEVPVTISFAVTPVRFKGVRNISSVWKGLDRGQTSYLTGTEYNTVLFNVVFYGDNGSVYYMRNAWEEWGALEDDDKMMSVGFIYDLRNQEDVKAEISCRSFPTSGRLAIRFYPPKGKYNVLINRVQTDIVCDFNLCTKIRDIALVIEINDTEDERGIITRSGSNAAKSGRSRQGNINAAHNITGGEDYIYGQTPKQTYGITYYKGGIYKNNTAHTPYSHFKRNSGASEVDNLLDLIGRETIQYHKKSWDILSGTVQVVDRTSVMRFGTFMYGGKRYLPISAALNLLANQMSVTSMLEIENYVEEAGITFSDYVGKSSARKSGSGGGSSSGLGYTAWGNITGNIDNQADLKDKLDERPTSEDVKKFSVSFSPNPSPEEGEFVIVLTNDDSSGGS